MFELPVADEAFEFADGDRFAFDAQDAGAFALRFLRADAAADRGQRTVAGDDVGGLLQLPGVQGSDEVGDADADGAGSHTAGIPAVQAARRFQPCLVEVVTIADLLEVGRADLRVLFAHGTRGILFAIVVYALGIPGVCVPGGVYLSSPILHWCPAARSASMAAARCSCVRYMPCRRMASSKSTSWPSNSGPSTQVKRVLPPTVTRQAPAHARAVDHQRVERHGCPEPVFFRGERHEFHHDPGPDGDTFVVMPALFFDQLLDDLRDEPLEPFRTVVGGDVEVFGYGTHGVGIDEHVAGLGADDDIGRDAVLAEPFDLGVDRGGAHAARYEEVAPPAELAGLHRYEFRGVSQRACEIGEGIARIQRAYFACRGADGLRHDGDAALRGVVVRDRERDAFAVLVDADDDELPGLRRMCDARCEDLHQPDALGEESFSSIGYINIFFPAAAIGREPHFVVILR